MIYKASGMKQDAVELSVDLFGKEAQENMYTCTKQWNKKKWTVYLNQT